MIRQRPEMDHQEKDAGFGPVISHFRLNQCLYIWSHFYSASLFLPLAILCISACLDAGMK